MKHQWCIIAVSFILALPAFADDIVLNNGNRITGTIVRLETDKLIVSTIAAGDIAIDPTQILTFSTLDTIDIHLKDSTFIKSIVQSADDGNISIIDDAGTVQTIAIDEIASINPPKSAWFGSVSIGTASTYGNSETENGNAAVDVAWKYEESRISLGIGYVYGRQQDPDTGDRKIVSDAGFIQGKYDYFLSNRVYMLASLRAERDKIANLKAKYSPSLGAGFQVIDTSTLAFALEAGFGYVSETYSNIDETSDYMAARAAYRFMAMFKPITFTHNFEYIPALEDNSVSERSDYAINADAAIRATLSGSLFAEFKTLVQYDAVPAPGAEKKDTQFMLAIGMVLP